MLSGEEALPWSVPRYSTYDPKPAPRPETTKITPSDTASPVRARQRRVPSSQPPIATGDSFTAAAIPIRAPDRARSR